MELLKAGKVWSESEEGEHSPELPTEEDLLDGTTFRDWQNILLLMLKIINEDDQTDFEPEKTWRPRRTNRTGVAALVRAAHGLLL